MKELKDFLKNNEEAIKQLLKHPRHKIIDEIWKRVNTDRVRDNYKPLSKKVFAIKTAHCSMDDLGFLLKKMQQSSYPGRVFFGLLKVRPTVDKPLE